MAEASLDMQPLLEDLRGFVEGREAVVWTADVDLADWGFRASGGHSVLVGRDVALELGHPVGPSRSVLLAVREAGAVRDARVTLIGPDIAEIAPGNRPPFAQVLLVAVDGEPDLLALDGLRTLSGRLPGWVVRTMPGRLWARLSRDAVARGLSLRVVGSALVAALHEVPRVVAVEVLFVTSSADDLAALEGLAVRADAASGRWRRLTLAPDGELECDVLDCAECEDQPACETLGEVAAIRRRRRG